MHVSQEKERKISRSSLEIVKRDALVGPVPLEYRKLSLSAIQAIQKIACRFRCHGYETIDTHEERCFISEARARYKVRQYQGCKTATMLERDMQGVICRLLTVKYALNSDVAFIPRSTVSILMDVCIWFSVSVIGRTFRSAKCCSTIFGWKLDGQVDAHRLDLLLTVSSPFSHSM